MIAQVIVDVLNGNTDRIFDYALPENLQTRAQPGCRVLVPFAGRRIEGLIVGLRQTTDVDPAKLKAVGAILDETPSVTREMLELMDEMSKNCHMLLADIVRLFIPAQMRGGRVRDKVVAYVAPSERAYARIDELPPNATSQTALLAYLLEGGGEPVKKSEICGLFSASAVNALIKKGLLIETDKRVLRTPYCDILQGGEETPDLTDGQCEIVDEISASESESKFLLHGVTGSGKTEVYLRCISSCIERGKSAILLVPEIALTPQMLRIFRSRFGDDVAILHSGLSDGERYDEWQRLRRGEAHIAIGARSAVFAPVENLGILIVDEEHEQSYVADGGKYDARKVAEFRCRYHGCALLLGSATPSVETYYRALRGEFRLLELPERINRKPMPAVRIVDMREELKAGNRSVFSAELLSRLDDCMGAGNQAMLFINRRGFASIVMCKECGYVAKCSDCDVTLTYHREEDVLKCHYCSQRFRMLDVCPQCGSKYIRQSGLGTERVAYELEKRYPGAGVLRMDNDTTRTKEAHFRIVRDFSEKKAQILVGTQMIAKGHDFKDVSLVGILDADLSLYFADYRSAERTFQLITQVSGRAGRADVEGAVVLQTYSPHHAIFKLAVRHDYKGFYEQEIALRQATHYPPFARILRLTVSGEDEQAAIEALKRIYADVEQLRRRFESAFLYLNKMRSPIKRIQKKYRFQILARLTGETADEVIGLIYQINATNTRRDVASYVEINPANMY